MGRHIENTFPIATGLTQIRLPSRISFVRELLQLDAMELISNVLRFHLNELFFIQKVGVDWCSEEEEKRNAVTRFPAGVADLVLGGRMALKATGLTVGQQTCSSV